MGLTYEKGDSEIFMSGYKFAAAKLTACSALGCLAKYVDEPEELGKVCLFSPREALCACCGGHTGLVQTTPRLMMWPRHEHDVLHM